MNNYFIYSIESGICLAVFYLAFLLMFRMDTFFAVSRAYILCTIIASVIIPVFNFSSALGNADVVPTAIFSTITVEANKVESAVNTSVGMTEIILAIYLTGVLIFLSRFIMRLFILFRLVRKNSISKEGGYKIVFTEEKYSPFSFFNIIFLSNSFVYNSETELILAHEKVHVDKHHTLDIILSEIITILQWFNPFVWFYKKSLQEVHEYQADEGVVKLGCNKVDYQKLILSKIAGSEIFQPANNFNYSLIKRRIKMITRNKTKRLALVKLLFVIPISLILFLSFSCSQNDNSNWNAMEDVIRIPENKIESHADFPTGSKDMWAFINNRMKIPQEIISKNTCGKIAVRFEVDVDGSIENVRIAQSKEIGGEWKKGELGYGCDEEAIRVVKEMPKWKPAISDGKPVKLTQSLILFFGSKEMEAKWNESERNKDNWMETKTDSDKRGMDINFEFPGGNNEMHDFIIKNIKYPEDARKKGIQGTVIVVFNVLKDGSITDVKIEKSVGSGCDEEAMRVIKLMPKWECKSDVKPNSQEVKLPIAFKLSNDKSQNKTQTSMSNDFVVLEKPQNDFVVIDMDALVKAIKYPEEARKKGIEGTVNLKVLFKKTGEVGNILVEKTDNNIFNEAAMNAVKTVKFTPAMNNGKKIDMWVSLPIKFKLK